MNRELIIKLAGVVVHPEALDFIKKVHDCIRWEKMSHKFGAIGHDTRAGHGFSIFHPECIFIGSGFRAGERLMLQAWPEYRGKATGLNKKPRLIIGNDVQVVQDCQISCADEIVIDDGCLFGGGVFITDNLHGSGSPEELIVSPYKRMLSSKGPVYIGKNVWLGRNVCVMPGVAIGDGAVIGANAVVTHDIPAYSVAAGVPAKVIRRTE